MSNNNRNDTNSDLINHNSSNQVELSSAVTEMISNKPIFIVRKGTGLIFLIIFLLLLGTWFIKYPDIIKTKAYLTAINAPKPIIPKTLGKLTQLNIHNGSTVKQGDIIGVLETTADPSQVILLDSILHQISVKLESNNYIAIDSVVRSIPNKNLGEIQTNYQTFIQSYITFRNYVEKGVFIKKLNLLQLDIERLNNSKQILQKQKVLNNKDVGLTQATYDANEKLLKDKIISQQEYREITSKLISKQIIIPQIESSFLALEAQQNDKQKEILELENQISTQRTTFQEALNAMKSHVEEWKLKYLLIASTSGKLNFTKTIQENQQIMPNLPIAYIIPPNTDYFLQTSIPQNNFGKVQQGQKVLIKFSAYQWQEYGVIEGKIQEIASVPADSNGYVAQIALTNGLLTNQSIQITYREGLIGDAEIITKDQRLLQRFYYSLTKAVSR